MAAFSVGVAADAIVLNSSPLMLRSPKKMDDSISAKHSSKSLFVELDADRGSSLG
jgi:hypothetical protein